MVMHSDCPPQDEIPERNDNLILKQYPCPHSDTEQVNSNGDIQAVLIVHIFANSVDRDIILNVNCLPSYLSKITSYLFCVIVFVINDPLLAYQHHAM